MTDETKPERIRLHHSVSTDSAPGTAGSDFAAGFGDDEFQPAAPAPAGEAGDGAPAGDPPPEGDLQPGVDTPENGAQVAPQPQGLNLDDLPEHLRQSVADALAEKERLALEGAELRRNFDALQGRVGPVQRELETTKRELARRTQTQQAPAQQPQPARPTLSSAVMAQFESEEFKQYERLFPEEAAIHKRNTLAVAEASDARIGQLEGVLGGTLTRVQQIEQESAQRARTTELTELDRAHPDWRELNTSDDFWDYFGETEHLYGFTSEEDKARRLQDRKFVSTLLTTYKQVRGFNQPQSQQQQQAPPQQAARAVVNLATAPRNAGGGIRRTAGEGRKGSDFMAGYQSDD